MPLFDIVLATLLALPPWHEDIGEVGREERLAVIASAIVEASDKATCWGPYGESFDDHFAPVCEPIWPSDERWKLAALLSMKAWMESRLGKRWHEARCREGECDSRRTSDGRLVFRATSPWQIQTSAVIPLELWQTAHGATQEATNAAAWGATLALAVARKRCGTVEGAVASYATGRSCRWSGAAKRVWFAARLEREFVERADAATKPPLESLGWLGGPVLAAGE